jgi:hypothetical protein
MLVPWMITAARLILPSAKLVVGHSSSEETVRNTAAPICARASGITASPVITITGRKTNVTSHNRLDDVFHIHGSCQEAGGVIGGIVVISVERNVVNTFIAFIAHRL